MDKYIFAFYKLYYTAYSEQKPYTTSENPNRMIFLITVMKFFTPDEINVSFLNNVVFCGIASNYTYADGRYLTPFEFVEHDITHGDNYQGMCFGRIGHSREKLKSFYNYCLSKLLERKEMYAIKIMMFLLIHETWCEFFADTKEDVQRITEKSILDSLLTTGLCKMNRFVNTNDLGLSIPKSYRKNEETITEYLKFAAGIYLRELNNWIIG
jgi:hypothetical protein